MPRANPLLGSDRTTNVVDRFAIERSDRGAISDKATVIHRTILAVQSPHIVNIPKMNVNKEK